MPLCVLLLNPLIMRGLSQMPRYRVIIRETYVMEHQTDTPAEAGEKAMECMNDHPDEHILMQEMQMIPMADDEELTWEGFPPSKDVH